MRGQCFGKKIVALLLTAGFVFVSLTGCGSSSEQVEEIPELIDPVGVDVDTVKVKKMNLSSVNSYQGEIVPELEGVSFMSSGNIGAMKVSVGDKVKKGQLLATLTSVDSGVKQLQKQIKEIRETNKDANVISQSDIERFQEELSQLQKQRKAARTKKERKGLQAQILEKQEDIKLAKLRLSQQKEQQALELKHLREDLEDAKSQTKESKLISPVNGEVITTAGGPGYMVQGGVTAVNIANMDKPRVRTDYIDSSKLGKASSYVAIVNGKQYKVKAEEQEISPFDIELGNIPTNTWFDFEDEVKLRVGDSATIELYNDTASDALVVPSNAVFRGKSDRYVYLMEGNNKKKITVTVGTVTDAYTQILTGVKEGDVVYVQS